MPICSSSSPKSALINVDFPALNSPITTTRKNISRKSCATSSRRCLSCAAGSPSSASVPAMSSRSCTSRSRYAASGPSSVVGTNVVKPSYPSHISCYLASYEFTAEGLNPLLQGLSPTKGATLMFSVSKRPLQWVAVFRSSGFKPGAALIAKPLHPEYSSCPFRQALPQSW